jgi:hypothetical protein
MMAAAQGGMAEVKLGEVAAKKATQANIKQFGTMMVSDHGKATKELQAIATKNGVTLPSKLDATHKDKVDKISKLSGQDFPGRPLPDCREECAEGGLSVSAATVFRYGVVAVPLRHETCH